jgi:hypothetical protein
VATLQRDMKRLLDTGAAADLHLLVGAGQHKVDLALHVLFLVVCFFERLRCIEWCLRRDRSITELSF